MTGEALRGDDGTWDRRLMSAKSEVWETSSGDTVLGWLDCKRAGA